ncbi:MAG: SIS domain-containing protein, partial [Bacteroidaceae bacterium]|nr:SIS domain-containing protein [Bacteroidaceae bacterium]
MIKDVAIKCLRDEAQAILNLIDLLDDNFDKAVGLMLNCRGKVIVTGVGKSGHIATKMAATLSSTGTPAFYVNPLDVFHGDLGVITGDDVVVAFSNSGHTDELLRFVPILVERGIPLIALTGNPQSLLA